MRPSLLIVLFLAVWPRAAAAEPLVTAVDALRAAVNAADAPAILEAQASLRGLAVAVPKDPVTHYWIAVAEWRAVPLLMQGDKALAKKHCEAGLAEAERAMALDPKFAEAMAIHAALQGLSLGFADPAAMMTIGPKIEESLQRALALAPDNPRVRLLDAINTLHKPAFVGGGPEKALDKFAKTLALFEADSGAKDLAPTAWGHDDALIWAGQAAMMLERYAQARDDFAKALELNPDQRWVKQTLLPRAEKALADTGQ